MPANLAHFAINADDVDASRLIYERIFGWSFTPWGPPGFFHINTGDTGPQVVQGALQQRRDLVPGRPTLGFECTIAVDDVDATARAVTAAGGEVIMAKTTITGVGDLIWFTDPSGNVAGAMRYDPAVE